MPVGAGVGQHPRVEAGVRSSVAEVGRMDHQASDRPVGNIEHTLVPATF